MIIRLINICVDQTKTFLYPTILVRFQLDMVYCKREFRKKKLYLFLRHEVGIF